MEYLAVAFWLIVYLSISFSIYAGIVWAGRRLERRWFPVDRRERRL